MDPEILSRCPKIFTEWPTLRQSDDPEVYINLHKLITGHTRHEDFPYLNQFFWIVHSYLGDTPVEGAKLLESVAIRVFQETLAGKSPPLRQLFNANPTEFLATLKDHVRTQALNALQFSTPWRDLIGVRDNSDPYEKFRPPDNSIGNVLFETKSLVGVHDRRLRLILLCKIMRSVKSSELVESAKGALLPSVIRLCRKLSLSYKLMSSNEISTEKASDCLPTCVELAFRSQVDDPNRGCIYQCEFSFFRHTMRFLERERPKWFRKLISTLDRKQIGWLKYFRYHYKPEVNLLSFKSLDSTDFQCLGHRQFVTERAVNYRNPKRKYCPLMKRDGWERRLVSLLRRVQASEATGSK